MSFDQLTKTKTIERLISLADETSLCALGQELCNKLEHPGVQDDKDATARRHVIADELTLVVKSPQSGHTSQDTESDIISLIDIIIHTVVKCAYLSVDASKRDRQDVPDPPVSSKTQGMLKARLASWLSHIIAKVPYPGHFTYMAVKIIRLNALTGALAPTVELTGSVSQRVDEAWSVLEAVQKTLDKPSRTNKVLEAFELLYSLTMLQVYNGDADAVSMLDELRNYYDLRIRRHNEGNQQGSEILVEILLGFIAKPSQLFRRLAQQVFSSFTSDINGSGLQSMIKVGPPPSRCGSSSLTQVLETSENLAGQEEMFEEEDEDRESTDTASGADSDVEEVELEHANRIQSLSDEEKPSSASDGSSEDTDNPEEKEGEDEELAAFDMKLAQALKTRPANADLVAGSDEESSDEDMDDEQMEALDEHIATIFKERKGVASRKTQKKDAKETMVNFKCRVLELLEIYVKQQHQKQIALDLLLPLLKVTRTTTSSLVSGKACNLVRDFNRICKGKDLPKISDTREVVNLLETVHAKAMHGSSNAHTSACSQASLLLVKVLVAQDKDNLRMAVDCYADTQKALLLDPKCKVKISFFTDWLNWCSTARAAR